MPYSIEVAINHDNLALELSRMRTWLDHMKFEVVGFRKIPVTSVCRVDFRLEEEATAFARSFGGRVLSRTAAMSVER